MLRRSSAAMPYSSSSSLRYAAKATAPSLIMTLVHLASLTGGHDVTRERVVARRRRVTEALPPVLEIVCGKGLAVRVLQAIPEGVRVRQPVGADLRLILGCRRDRLARFDVECHQSFVDLHRDADLVHE